MAYANNPVQTLLGHQPHVGRAIVADVEYQIHRCFELILVVGIRLDHCAFRIVANWCSCAIFSFAIADSSRFLIYKLLASQCQSLRIIRR